MLSVRGRHQVALVRCRRGQVGTSDALMEISEYLETHGIGVPSRLVYVFLIRIKKGIDCGDDMPRLFENRPMGTARVSIGHAGRRGL